MCGSYTTWLCSDHCSSCFGREKEQEREEQLMEDKKRKKEDKKKKDSAQKVGFEIWILLSSWNSIGGNKILNCLYLSFKIDCLERCFFKDFFCIIFLKLKCLTRIFLKVLCKIKQNFWYKVFKLLTMASLDLYTIAPCLRCLWVEILVGFAILVLKLSEYILKQEDLLFF